MARQLFQPHITRQDESLLKTAMPARIVGFAGSLSRPSRTRALVDLATARAAAAFGATAATYDLTDLQPSLGSATTLEDLDGLSRSIVASILSADALIVGSPVYKGSYAGLFKHLFDLIEPAAIAGKPVLLTATGGGEKHALMIEHQLRPQTTFTGAALQNGGLRAVFDDTDVLGEIAGGFVVLRRDWTLAHPEEAKAFVDGSTRALDYARENPEETKAIFARVLAERDENADVAQFFAGYGVREGGLPVERDIQFWIDVLERQGTVEKGKLVAKDILFVTGDSPATN
jgi:MsuE subfamily FMN reductase